MMIFISYDEAPAEMVAKLYKELEEVTKGLTRKDDPDEEAEVKKSVAYFRVDEQTASVNDMIILVEDESSKMVMYMGGTIKAEDVKGM